MEKCSDLNSCFPQIGCGEWVFSCLRGCAVKLLLEVEVKVSTYMGFVALPWIVASPRVWVSACPGIGMIRTETLLSSKLLCTFQAMQCVLCVHFWLRWRFQALQYWAPRSPAEGDKMVPGSLEQPQSLISRLQSRGFCKLKDQKMLFNIFKGLETQQIKTQRRIYIRDHA